jgi:hypothetical protein
VLLFGHGHDSRPVAQQQFLGVQGSHKERSLCIAGGAADLRLQANSYK